MPTIKTIKDILDINKIPFTSKMKKTDLIQLLEENDLGDFEYQDSINCGINTSKGVVLNGTRYDKKWEKSSQKSYRAFLLSKDAKMLLVKGHATGNGLGAGGSKWRFDHVEL
jgi:hypothetical protein